MRTFLDIVDTVRTDAKHPFRQRVEDYPEVVKRTIFLELLLGNRILLTQTQAFDSGFVLSAATGAGHGSFLELLRNGRIAIPLWQHNSLTAAMQSALKNPNFIFSAWPEIDHGVDRKEVHEALSTGGPDPGLVGEKLEAIRRIDIAIGGTRHKASKPSFNLAPLVREAAAHLPPEVRERFDRQPYSERRSDYYELLDEPGFDIAEPDRAVARQVVDGCYNRVVASSLRAEQLMLTASLPAPVNILALTRSSDPAKPSRDRFITPLVGFNEAPDLNRALSAIDWSGVRNNLAQQDQHKSGPEALAVVAKGLARVAIEHGRYAAVIRLADHAAGGLVIGAPAAIGAALGAPVAVAIAATAFGAALPGLWHDEQHSMKLVTNLVTGRIEKQFYGLLEARLSGRR